MPQTEVKVYRTSAHETPPLIEWLETLESNEPRVHAKCLERIIALAHFGHEIRRPLAAHLRDGIHELRAQVGKVHYRMLYFSCGKNEVMLSHGFSKEGKVPPAEIEKALSRKAQVEKNPVRHTAEF